MGLGGGSLKILKVYTHSEIDGDIALSTFFLKKKFTIQLEFAEEPEPDGVGIDIPGGMFDHHKRPENRCSAAMVAEVMGGITEREKELLEHVNRIDLHGKDEPLGLLTVTSHLNRYLLDEQKTLQWVWQAFEAFLAIPEKLLSPNDEEEKFLLDLKASSISWQTRKAIENTLAGKSQKFSVIQFFLKISRHQGIEEAKQWLRKGIEAKQRQQKLFTEAQQILQKGQGKTYFVQALGKTLKILTIETKNLELHKAARALGYAVVIQRSAETGTQIFINRRLGLKIDAIAASVRASELAKRGIQMAPEKLAGLGTLAIVPQWHAMEQCLLCGSLKHRSAPRTKLSLEELAEITKLALVSKIRFETKISNCPLCENLLRPGVIICQACNDSYWMAAKQAWQKGEILNFNTWLQERANAILTGDENLLKDFLEAAKERKVNLVDFQQKRTQSTIQSLPSWRRKALQRFAEGNL